MTTTNIKTQKIITLGGVRYTAKNLLDLNKSHGSDFSRGDRCISLSAGDKIGIRIYEYRQIVCILDYGLASRSGKKLKFAAPYKFLKY